MRLLASLSKTLVSSILKCKPLWTEAPSIRICLTLTSIFLYFFLLACFVGVVYFFYTIWIAPYFPQKRSRGGDRTKRGAAKKGAADEGISATGTEGAAVTTGSKAYNEEWIPAHHIQKPQARTVKSGTPKSKSKSKAEA
jgi:hypothetical protein